MRFAPWALIPHDAALGFTRREVWLSYCLGVTALKLPFPLQQSFDFAPLKIHPDYFLGGREPETPEEPHAVEEDDEHGAELPVARSAL